MSRAMLNDLPSVQFHGIPKDYFKLLTFAKISIQFEREWVEIMVRYIQTYIHTYKLHAYTHTPKHAFIQPHVHT
jgi:hypothetical protein